MDGCDAMRDAISIGVCPPRRESSESLIRFKIDPGGAAVPACCRAEGPPSMPAGGGGGAVISGIALAGTKQVRGKVGTVRARPRLQGRIQWKKKQRNGPATSGSEGQATEEEEAQAREEVSIN